MPKYTASQVASTSSSQSIALPPKPTPPPCANTKSTSYSSVSMWRPAHPLSLLSTLCSRFRVRTSLDYNLSPHPVHSADLFHLSRRIPWNAAYYSRETWCWMRSRVYYFQVPCQLWLQMQLQRRRIEWSNPRRRRNGVVGGHGVEPCYVL